MTIHLLLVASLLLQGVPTGVPAMPASAPSSLDAVRVRINALITEREVPSMAVAVVHRGKIVWEEGFGWADVQNRIPATSQTVFTLASVGKSITATAVMVLAARGALRLDDPVRKHLGPRGRMPGGDRRATIRQLLTMRGGVGHMWRHNWLDEAGPIPSNADVVETFGAECLPPGMEYHYSNLSYGVLQEVVESARGAAGLVHEPSQESSDSVPCRLPRLCPLTAHVSHSAVDLRSEKKVMGSNSAAMFSEPLGVMRGDRVDRQQLGPGEDDGTRAYEHVIPRGRSPARPRVDESGKGLS